MGGSTMKTDFSALLRLLALLLQVLDERSEDEPRPKRRKTHDQTWRDEHEILDLRDSVWWRFIQRPRVRDPTTREGRLFRRRFRVPYWYFQRLCSMFRDNGWGAGDMDVCGRQSQPLELKILAALRVLGRGECFDTCSELSNISESTLRRFFHDFVRHMGPLHKERCTPPTGAELKEHMDLYARIGFPGCVGSTDGVHIHWQGCPAGWRSSHEGKE